MKGELCVDATARPNLKGAKRRLVEGALGAGTPV
jgi:hypothetical protein